MITTVTYITFSLFTPSLDSGVQNLTAQLILLILLIRKYKLLNVLSVKAGERSLILQVNYPAALTVHLHCAG